MNERVVGIKQSDVWFGKSETYVLHDILSDACMDGWMECMIINTLIYVYMCL